MAAELFSTSLPQGEEVEVLEVKKSFIQVSDLQLTAEDICGDSGIAASQPNNHDGNPEETDRWQASHPTLRER